jgi:hypothetical protein
MSLLRRPGATVSSDQMTGDIILDDFLTNLDAAFIGSRKVRVLYVAEAKDHLLEARQLLAEQGKETEAASKAAVLNFGDAREHAQSQRRLVWARFWQTVMTAGPFYGVFMFAWMLIYIREVNVIVASISTAIAGVLFGITMGWFIAFVHPQKLLPSMSAKGNKFICAYSSKMRTMNYAFMAFIAACVLMGIGTAFEIDALNPFDMSKTAAIVLGLMAVLNIGGIRLGNQRLFVDDKGIKVRKLFSRDSISWSQLRNLTLLGETKRWIPKWSYWSRVHVLEYADSSGQSQTIMIFPDTENSDRAVCICREKLGARSGGLNAPVIA